MPTREQTIADAIRVFESADYPSGLSKESAWMGVYQALLWCEPVNWLGISELPHIIDADKLRPSSPAKRRSWTNVSIWQKRAQAVGVYLAEQLGCTADDLPSKTDLLMRLPQYEGMQRQNTLGIAFSGVIRHILEKLGSSEISYETEVEATRIFPGITLPGRSAAPRIDVLATGNGIPRAIISAKWSVRHDRLNDITNECPIYKAAYERIYRGASRRGLPYYVITNEYDPARLNKMLSDTCVDSVVHVHKPAVTGVCGMDGRLVHLVDLADFVSSTSAW